MGWAYVAMSAGDLISVALLTLVNPPVRKRADKSSPFRDMKEGAMFSLKSPLVRTLLGAILLNELFGWSHEPMLPVMARDVLGMGATGLGNLLAAGSLGAAVTSVALSSFENPRKKGVLLVAGMFGYGCSCCCSRCRAQCLCRWSRSAWRTGRRLCMRRW